MNEIKDMSMSGQSYQNSLQQKTIIKPHNGSQGLSHPFFQPPQSWEEGQQVSKPYNANIIRVMRLTREMIILADDGDKHRQDKTCGVLYGLLRDNAYKLRNLCEKEIEVHKKSGIWADDTVV